MTKFGSLFLSIVGCVLMFAGLVLAIPSLLLLLLGSMAVSEETAEVCGMR
jgi:hypothetical protein